MVGQASHSCAHYREPLKVGKGTMLASSIRGYSANGKKNGSKPDGGVYLDPSWLPKLGVVGHRLRSAPGFVTVYLHWQDMGVPAKKHLSLALRWTRDLLEAGKSVEVACIGGHGRTGTFLACLLREHGYSAQAAILAVREEVCPNCIESAAQIALIKEWQIQ